MFERAKIYLNPLQWKCIRNCGFIVWKNIERTLCVCLYIGVGSFFLVKFNMDV